MWLPRMDSLYEEIERNRSCKWGRLSRPHPPMERLTRIPQQDLPRLALGKILEERRTWLKLTQKEVALRAGTSQTAICRVEKSGNISLPGLRAHCSVLCIRPSKVLLMVETIMDEVTAFISEGAQ